MAWEKGLQKTVRVEDSLSIAKMLEGNVTDDVARDMLFRLFRDNLGFAWAFFSRQKLFEFQEIIMNGWFRKDYSIFVAGRGVGKSYLLAVFCLMYCIFYPGCKIVLVANNFRRVKDIFSQMEKFLKSRPAVFLRQCFFENMGKQNDQYILKCRNGSQIKGLPLGVGENLRGERANVLIIDEGLLISEHIQETILRPFLTAKLDVKEQDEIKAREDYLISVGKMKEEDRWVFPNNKLIITSSASYQFEYLYEGIYKPYIKNISDDSKDRTPIDPSYFAARMSYEALPPNSIMDESVIAAASDGKKEDPTFQREYCARFVDASDSYFNIRKLHECTVKDGQLPTVQVRGLKDAEYILAIDPAYGNSRANDFFAMGVYQLDPETRRIIQVHSYGKAGEDVKHHFQYLIYLLNSFNIVYLVIDASGTEFIDAFNNSELARIHGKSLGYITADFEDENYPHQISIAKREHNRERGTIVYPQKFSGPNNRRMNEYLQGGISAEKVWFGSRICQNKNAFNAAVDFQMPFPFMTEENQPYTIGEFLRDQDDWVKATKAQLALIQVGSTGMGTLQYDIPTHLKKSKSATRARRDNYTCLLMAYYASKHYFDMLYTPDEAQSTFVPMLF